MSATIRSKIVDLDELIPMPGDIQQEDKDVECLIPWIFRHATTADEKNSHCRKVSEKQRFGHFIGSQGMMLRALMKPIYCNLEGIKRGEPENSLKNTIGGKQFGTRLEGAVTLGPRAECLPLIPYTGWFEGQTWSQFLGETLSVMLGQLAASMSIQSESRGFQDQETFAIGFHGLHIHIACGVFTADSISKVQREGCSKDDIFDLSFTRGYNLCVKEDWLEATRALSRLFRYLLSRESRPPGK
ncbi:hypothetical protein P170DRAFT_459282 [Aspergillus steynii IBT 23096]|uniref:Uncharacterized protein n=1 Tax=Aspergillus steynii IBT 23096 TaxID=1392250 RepID=A0A2I2FSN5_9EURO|nr:uncharacterized protein P170DRAFT_459282 [Aspergillus steynii IBT 23096]PLB43627.1 hypothetical protein P170DRAFT_459282 [Aspergillus steynii IBT 23096]